MKSLSFLHFWKIAEWQWAQKTMHDKLFDGAMTSLSWLAASTGSHPVLCVQCPVSIIQLIRYTRHIIVLYYTRVFVHGSDCSCPLLLTPLWNHEESSLDVSQWRLTNDQPTNWGLNFKTFRLSIFFHSFSSLQYVPTTRKVSENSAAV